MANFATEPEYSVERIEDNRIINGKTKYYNEWKNTWEPVKNLQCPDLIAAYKESFKPKEAKPAPNNEQKAKRNVAKEKKETNGFERGLEPSKI